MRWFDGHDAIAVIMRVVPVGGDAEVVESLEGNTMVSER
jgi:hypothetical protein